MHRSGLALTFFTALLSGCATYQADTRRESLQKAETELAASKSCCADFSSMSYGDLALDESRKFNLDTKAPVFEFQSGRSRFVALRLPDTTRFNLAITTYLHGGNYINTSFIFFPSVAFLDSNFRVVAVARNLTTQFRSGFASRGGWSGSIVVDRERLQATYLILFSENDGSGKSASLNLASTTSAQYGKTIAIRSEGRDYSVPFGREGVVSVAFESQE